MFAVLFLLSSLTLGVTLALLIPAKLRLEERLAMGTAIGLAVGGLTTFLLALVIKLTLLSIGSIIVAELAAVVVAWRLRPLAKQVRAESRDLGKRSRTREWRLNLLVFVLLGGLLSVIMWHAAFVSNGTMYAGFSNIWGDWNQHLAQTTSFAYADNLPPQLNVLSGQKITYPLMMNFLSAILVKGGFGLLEGMKVPGMFLILSGLGMLMTFTRVLAGPKAVLLTPILFYLFGGWGFVNFFNDLLHNQGHTLGYLLAHQPHNYTQTWGAVPIPNINWINPVFAYLIPQRALLFGFPLALSIMTLLFLALGSRDRRLFLAAGLIAVLLPLVHTHSLLFLLFFTLPLVPLSWRILSGKRKRRWSDLSIWGYFLVPVVVVAIPQAAWLSHGVDPGNFFRFQFGWTAHTDNFLWFWLKNLGLYFPLAIAAIIWLRKRNYPLLAFTVSAGFVWILANLYVFQPWDWDNSKLLVYWFVVSLPGVAAMLVWLADRGRVMKAGVVVMIVSMTFAGTLDVSKAAQWQSYKTLLFDAPSQEFATYVRDHSSKDSIWLTAQQANNPVAVLGGRRIVLGYTGWLWSYGLRYHDREVAVKHMFEAQPDSPDLLRQYSVSYIVIGPEERGDQGYRVNESYYRQHYAVWYEVGQISVYDLTRPIAPTFSGV